MAKGNEIVVTGEPRGRFLECIVSGTPKPGTVMELKWSVTTPTNGRWTYEPAGTTANSGTTLGMAADGNRLPIAVLLPDRMQGGLATTAYVSGTVGYLYFPLPGDEINMLIKDETGTGDTEDYVPGVKLIVDDGTGKLIQSSSTPESEPFICLETVTDVAADTLTWCMFTGC